MLQVVIGFKELLSRVRKVVGADPRLGGEQVVLASGDVELSEVVRRGNGVMDELEVSGLGTAGQATVDRVGRIVGCLPSSDIVIRPISQRASETQVP